MHPDLLQNHNLLPKTNVLLPTGKLVVKALKEIFSPMTIEGGSGAESACAPVSLYA
jgi:hypothetical protein